MKLHLTLLLQSLWACIALAGIIPRAEVYSSMEDVDPKTATSRDSIYTDGLETCISLTALGTVGSVANRKIMVHVSATEHVAQGDARLKTDKFIGAVASAGFQQGTLRIYVTAPTSGYVASKASVDSEFAEDVNHLGGIQGLQLALNLLVQYAVQKATNAITQTGGSENDVITFTHANPSDPIPERGVVRMEANGRLWVEGRATQQEVM